MTRWLPLQALPPFQLRCRLRSRRHKTLLPGIQLRHAITYGAQEFSEAPSCAAPAP